VGEFYSRIMKPDKVTIKRSFSRAADTYDSVPLSREKLPRPARRVLALIGEPGDAGLGDPVGRAGLKGCS
jgi:hypothetical protein